MRYFREYDVNGIMFTDYGSFEPVHGPRSFPSFAGQQVSIFNFGCNQLTAEGLRWNTYNFQEWWQGTLNEALGDSISFRADGYYLIYQTYDIKGT